jgi:hypothetical protein
MHKGFKCLDISTCHIYISCDVIFDESVFPFTSLNSNVGARYTSDVLLVPSSTPGDNNFTNEANDPTISVLPFPDSPVQLRQGPVLVDAQAPVPDSPVAMDSRPTVVMPELADPPLESFIDFDIALGSASVPGAMDHTFHGSNITSGSAPAPGAQGHMFLPPTTAISDNAVPQLLPPVATFALDKFASTVVPMIGASTGLPPPESSLALV